MRVRQFLDNYRIWRRHYRMSGGEKWRQCEKGDGKFIFFQAVISLLGGFIFMGIMVIICLSMCSCASVSSKNTVKTSRVTRQTAGAMKAEDTNVITLTDGEIELPKEYRYSKLSGADLTTYFVFNPEVSNAIADKRDGRSAGDYEEAVRLAWEQAKKEAEKKVKGLFSTDEDKATAENDVFTFDTSAYTTAYNENTYMYIYEGIDRATPDESLENYEIIASLNSYIQNSIGANVQLTAMVIDPENVPKSMENVYPESIPQGNEWLYEETLNGEFYVVTFSANSGDYMMSTYSTICYPSTYYGLYMVEKDCKQGSIRRWYGFVFTNNSAGGYFSEEEYGDVLSQIKDEFQVTTFYTYPWNKTDYSYEKDKDYRDGRTYEQFEELMLGTTQYHKMHENITYNIDELTDEEIQADDAITIIDFDTVEGEE